MLSGALLSTQSTLSTLYLAINHTIKSILSTNSALFSLSSLSSLTILATLSTLYSLFTLCPLLSLLALLTFFYPHSPEAGSTHVGAAAGTSPTREWTQRRCSGPGSGVRWSPKGA